jgi:pimeloyl-ACP methyl ester carboxylesterase
MSEILVGGRPVTYRHSPGMGRTFVFVHGISASNRTWRPLLDGEFGARFRCFAPDLPGHGGSAPFAEPADCSVPGYATFLREFVRAVDATDFVVVGWSLGGNIVLEAAPDLEDAAGFVVFGAPPLDSPPALAVGFLPNPAMDIGFTAEVGEPEAATYAANFLAPGSSVPVQPFVNDILATDPGVRAGLAASVSQGRFRDEVAVVAALRQRLAVLHGAEDRLASLDYLRGVTFSRLWRGEVQVVPGAGHALQEEAPDRLAELLTEFAAEL